MFRDNTPITLVMRKLDPAQRDLLSTLRGLLLQGAIHHEPHRAVRPTNPAAQRSPSDSSVTLTNTITGAQKFYRAAMSAAP